jgi:hypothetical protein
MPADRFVLVAQSAVYVITGLWSLVSRATFERVTGPKTDYWLVRMVGLLALVIGISLYAGARQTVVTSPVWILAIGSAASFAAIDITYALPRRISRVYLLDAALEIAILIGLVVSRQASGTAG